MTAASTSPRNPSTPGAWWRDGVIYQIYPRSFQDSNGDGVGDLEGIRRRLDYLVWLGVDAIWVSPFYPSPMYDFGYDVSDYCGVDAIFGSLESFDALVADAHARGLKVILDFVPNHSSIEHPWFKESRSGQGPKTDWYIWRDGAPGGGPPNNWISNFGGSAWTFDEARGQYYYHAFLPEQPDLNWRNPEVRAAMQDVLRFWLRRGVDGFRVDVIWHLIKDEALRDNPKNHAWTPKQPEIERFLQIHSADQPEVHSVIAEMRGVLEEFGDRLLIGEIYLPMQRVIAYYGEASENGLGGAHLPFNFQLIEAPWIATTLGEMIEAYEGALPPGAWPNWVLSNHDRPRIAARVGPRQARVAAMLLLTLRGTPTLYYGDELGIENVEIPESRIRDPWALREPGLGVGRDPERTPMQWDAGPFAGFSTDQPWLPLTPDWPRRNVAEFGADPTSILSLVRALLRYRRARRSLSRGKWRRLPCGGDLLAYERRDEGERTIVVLNLGAAAQVWPIPPDLPELRIVISTNCDRAGEASRGSSTLRADEGLMFDAS
ncbi:alpha-amylase family glycosyl hydrolase [Methylocella tundrae]|nr:alpha-amylase family glycosyl hydrolase [Methylocella tundrae]WPP05684.1 alpha-amylase family glycosyl hydrolase [Methylocella tundrae]